MLISSSPSSALTMSTCSLPSLWSTCANGSTHCSEKTPINWFLAPAGFESGPNKLKIVLTAISLRGPIVCFMALWCLGANKNPTPIVLTHWLTCSADKSRLTPAASKTSALPERLETDRLPCLATCPPAAATTKATVVEILKVLAPSPPVPQVSITC